MNLQVITQTEAIYKMETDQTGSFEQEHEEHYEEHLNCRN